MYYGAIYKIEEQLNQFGYTLGDKQELIEKLHFGLNICHIHGIITEKEWNRGLQRLNKMVGKYAKSMEGDKDEQNLR